MPKLPEQSKNSTLEVLDKENYSRGELTIPKVPKHRIVLRHHLKLAGALVILAIVLVGVYVGARPMMGKQEESQKPNTDTVAVPSYNTQSFRNYSEEDYKNIKIDNSIWIVVETIDVQNKVVEGHEYDDTSKKHAVKFGEKAEFYWLSAPNEDGTGGGEKIPVKFDQIMAGSVIKVLSFENPKESVTLTVVSAEKIV